MQTIFDENSIRGFFNEWRFLSNFYPCTIKYNGLLFPSVENAYMSAKCKFEEDRIKFVDIEPSEAKKLGYKIKLREDWEDVKLKIMNELVHHKFFFNSELGDKLLETGDKYLEELNFWGDTFWGVYQGKGKNNLGKILMSVRNQLK